MTHEPTTSELERLIERNHHETAADILDLKTQLSNTSQMFTATIDKYVLLAVYTVEIAGLRREVTELRDEVTTARRTSRQAVIGAISAIVAAVLGAIILGAMKGTGH